MSLRWTLLILGLCQWSFEAAAVAVHKTIAIRDDEVLLPCGTNDNDKADWWFQCPERDCVPVRLVDTGNIVNGHTARFSVIKDEEMSTSLRITAARVTDTGTYTCIGDGGRGEKVFFQLSVFDAAATAPIMTFAVFSGDDVVLPCHADKAEPAVDWWFQQKPGVSPERIYSAGLVVNGFSRRFLLDRSSPLEQNLGIHKIQANESGLYTCIAEAGQGRKISIRVNVLVRSEIDRILSQDLSAGTTVQLPCSVNSTSIVSWWYERSTVTGMKEISQLGHIFNLFVNKVELRRNNSNSQYDLVLRSAALDDSGLYTCIEEFDSDGVGRRTQIRLVVKGMPTLVVHTTSSLHHDDHRSSTLDQRLIALIGVLSIAGLIAVAVILRRFRVVNCYCYNWGTHQYMTFPMIPSRYTNSSSSPQNVCTDAT